MTLRRATIRAFLLLLAAAAPVPAQIPGVPTPARAPRKRRVRPPQPPYNPNAVLLDPAHGGSDSGADLGPAGLEKDLNYAFSERLRALLTSKGFTIVVTRGESSPGIPPDQRAEIANRSRAVACLLIHTTTAGHGVHLFTSALADPPPGQPLAENYIAPWDTAQTPSLARSGELANQLATALNNLHAPLTLTRVSVNPIDSFACAAVAIEIAPESGHSSVADGAYQQRIAESVAGALVYWRDQAKAQIDAQMAAFQAAQAAASGQSPQPPAPAPKPRPKPHPRPIVPPEETPLAPSGPHPAHPNYGVPHA